MRDMQTRGSRTRDRHDAAPRLSGETEGQAARSGLYDVSAEGFGEIQVDESFVARWPQTFGERLVGWMVT